MACYGVQCVWVVSGCGRASLAGSQVLSDSSHRFPAYCALLHSVCMGWSDGLCDAVPAVAAVSAAATVWWLVGLCCGERQQQHPTVAAAGCCTVCNLETQLPVTNHKAVACVEQHACQPSHTQRLHHSYHQPCCSHQTVATLQRRAQQTLQPPHTLLLHEAGDTVAGEAAHQGTAEPGSQADAALQWLSLVHAAVVTCCLAGSAGASVPCKLSTTCSNNSRDTTIAKAGNTTGTFKPACDMHANPARVSLLCTGVCPDPTKSAAMLGASKDSF